MSLESLATDDLICAKFHCYDGEQLALNIVQYRVKSVAGGSLSLKQWIDQLSIDLAGSFSALIYNDAFWWGVSGFIYGVSPISVEIYPTYEPLPGTAGTKPLPRQTSGIITKGSDARGRANRGRMYIGFPASNDSRPTLDQPTADYIVRLASLAGLCGIANDLTVTVGAGSVTTRMVIQRPVAAPATGVECTRFVARSAWATQRRRGDYGRPNGLPFT